MVSRSGRCCAAVAFSTVLDGELVVADECGRADFGALQARLTVRGQNTWQAAAARPAVLAVFDVLELEGRQLLTEPLSQRRSRLINVITGLDACFQVVTQTPDLQLAKDWLAYVPSLEGVVAKRADGRYRPGRREWIKVKRARTADCVVVGLAGDETEPMLVLALRHSDGELHHFGITHPVRALESGPLPELLERAGPPEKPIRSPWRHQEIARWRRVPPEAVCEVRFSNIDAGRWLRQPATLLRWRPDRSASDCRLDQLTVADM